MVLRLRRIAWFATVSMLAVCAVLLPTAAAKPANVTVQILAVNDFHGALDPSLTKPNATDQTTWYYRGGAEYLANFVNAAAATNPNTVKVSAGDMIGASPLLSALFHDEPTIMAFNQMGFAYNVTGNHEYDEGWNELLRMQAGGCHPIDGCSAGVPAFPGASFEYLAGNVERLDTGQTLFAGYDVRKVGGVKVGFVGIALDSTPTIVVPSAVVGLQFQAEVKSINHYVKLLQKRNLKAIVVLLHDGAGPAPSINACNDTDPFFTNIVKNINPEVDVVVTGHTHNAYNCQIQVKKKRTPMLVTSAGYNGRYLTDIDLTIAGSNQQVISTTATNVPVETPYLTAVPDLAMKTLLDQYRAASAPLSNRIVGSITADISRTGNAAGESALGDVLADAQLAASEDTATGDAVIAMTNPGGIRTDVLFSQISGGELPGQVTFGEAFAVQPFSNSLVTVTLTGAQIKTVLEQQFVGCGQPAGGQKILQVSVGFSYSWNSSAAACSKVSNLMLNGVAVDPATSYRVTINNFLAGGGDNFPGFIAGTNPLTGMIDLDAFVDYLGANSPVAPGPRNRITTTT